MAVNSQINNVVIYSIYGEGPNKHVLQVQFDDDPLDRHEEVHLTAAQLRSLMVKLGIDRPSMCYGKKFANMWNAFSPMHALLCFIARQEDQWKIAEVMEIPNLFARRVTLTELGQPQPLGYELLLTRHGALLNKLNNGRLASSYLSWLRFWDFFRSSKKFLSTFLRKGEATQLSNALMAGTVGDLYGQYIVVSEDSEVSNAIQNIIKRQRRLVANSVRGV